MHEEQIVKDGQKILKIINSCVTIAQIEMADAIVDRYVEKWSGKVDVVPVRFLCMELDRRDKFLTGVFYMKDDGTEYW